ELKNLRPHLCATAERLNTQYDVIVCIYETTKKIVDAGVYASMFKDLQRRLQRDTKKTVDARVHASSMRHRSELKAQPVEVNVIIVLPPTPTPERLHHSKTSLGTNPGAYAKELMRTCEDIVLDTNNVSVTNPVELLCRGVKETSMSGSSNIWIANFNGQEPNKLLGWAYYTAKSVASAPELDITSEFQNVLGQGNDETRVEADATYAQRLQLQEASFSSSMLDSQTLTNPPSFFTKKIQQQTCCLCLEMHEYYS
ncbi:probable protein phosphatase 2C 62, partial [Tanacetum coccineum]